MTKTAVEIAVVGGGPVGLTLAGLLAQCGIGVTVLEQRRAITPHSRAIGIHPPALEVLETLGVAKQMRNEGVAIRGGQVFYGSSLLGRLPIPETILSLPQACTEAILERRLGELAPAALRRGTSVQQIVADSDGVTLHLCSQNNGSEILRAGFVVGCDGKGSAVRAAAGIGFRGTAYSDTYLMGDFDDDTDFGSDAALSFTTHGIVESFPLPQGKRRWVAHTPTWEREPTAERLSATISPRIGRVLPTETCTWVSPFGIQGLQAERFVAGRFALAGDAAHVVSPIGGQGMNLGILDAAAFAAHWNGSPASLSEYDRVQRRRARIALHRADFNTAMGRPMSLLSPRRAIIAAALSFSPVSRRLLRAFTMRDL